MKILRTPLALTALLLTGFGAAATLSAQDADITYSSWTSRPVIRVAQDYILPEGETVTDVRVIFGNATIDGQVDGDVLVVFGTARLGPKSVIDGTIAVIGGSADAAPGAAVRSDFVVIGGTLNAPAGFDHGGEHVVIGSEWLGGMLSGVVPWVTRGLIWGRLIVPDLGWIWTIVGIFFMLYLALAVIFDGPVTATANAVRAKPLSMFMTGLLVLILTIPALAIVAASVIGLLLIPFIVCALVVAALFGKAAVCRAIGRSVIRSEEETRAGAVAAFAIGFAVLTLAYLVPVLGFVTWALTSVLGFGAATVTLRQMLRRERPVPPAPPAGPTVPVTYAPAVFDTPGELSAPVAFAAPASPEVPAAFAAPASPVAPASAASFASAANLAAYPRATFLDRLAAFAIDAILVAIICELLDWNHQEGTFPMVLLAYHIAFWAWKGTTLGGIVCSLRVVRTHGAELRPIDAVIRGLTSVLSLCALGIGAFWMLWDPESQTWHDKIAGTLVVKVPRELVLP